MDDPPRSPLTCCLLTPPGMGAIAVVRVRGEGAWDLVRELVGGRSKGLPADPAPGRLVFGVFDDGSGAIDDVIVAGDTCLTGREPVVDISCHGGARIVERVLLALTRGGATLATANDTPRPSLSIRDAILQRAAELAAQATTRRGARFLLAQTRLLADALEAIAAMADAGKAEEAYAGLQMLLADSAGAEFLHHPAEVAIIGPANAGKSTLANALTGRADIVVADGAGTTRDWVTLDTAFDGVPVTLIDTAGVRPSEDHLELVAIQRGQERALHADAHLLVLDTTAGGEGGQKDRWESMLGDRRHICVLNKIDALPASRQPPAPGASDLPQVAVSARTGAGLSELRQAVISLLGIHAQIDDRRAVFCSAMARRLRSLEARDLQRRDSGEVASPSERIRRAVTG